MNQNPSTREPTGDPVEHPADSPLETALRRFAPAVSAPVLDGGDVAYLVEQTAIGPMLLATRADGRLVASIFMTRPGLEDAVLDRLARVVSPRLLRGGRSLDEARRQLQEYLGGSRRKFDLRVDPVLASPFQRAVLTRLAADVEYGHRTSYGRLAAAIGRPRAARAVGTALGANPLCVVLPCHRVIAVSGALTGYAGGVEAKRRLLALESR